MRLESRTISWIIPWPDLYIDPRETKKSDRLIDPSDNWMTISSDWSREKLISLIKILTPLHAWVSSKYLELGGDGVRLSPYEEGIPRNGGNLVII